MSVSFPNVSYTKVHAFFFAVGTSFLRAFGVTFLFAVTGILTAPNQQAALALSWAALDAAVVSGLRALQFLPVIRALTWASVIRSKVAAALADSFTRAFLGAFVTAFTGWLAAPDWGAWHSAILAIILGAFTAGARALQGAVTPGESPSPGPKPA